MRYTLLCHRSLVNKNDLKNSCKNIVTKWIQEEDKYRFGNTQIFFRAGQVAYLEQIRANLRKKYITIIQSVIRRFIARRRFQRLQRTALGIQRYGRGFLARQKAQSLREARAAMIISKYARGLLCRRRYLKLRRSVCGIQQYARGLLARRRFQEALDHYRATQIQRFVRGYLARRAFNKRRRDIIICQAAVRRFLARRKFKRLKAEAKTISHIQKKYSGLENKIISMQQKIDDLNKENSNLKHKITEIPVLKMKLDMKKSLENELKTLKLASDDKDKLIHALNKQIELERDEKMLLLEERESTYQDFNEQKRKWAMENEELRQQVDQMIEMAKDSETKTAQQREKILTDMDNNELNEAYQKALKDKEVIENENYMLKEELSRFHKSHSISGDYNKHSRSISNASSQNEDDVGYASAKNTLEMRRNQNSLQLDQMNTSPEAFAKIG